MKILLDFYATFKYTFIGLTKTEKLTADEHGYTHRKILNPKQEIRIFSVSYQCISMIRLLC